MVDETRTSDTVKATYEKAKETFKGAAAEVLGTPRMAEEGQAQRTDSPGSATPTQSPSQSGRGMTARDVMTPDVRCVRSSDTVTEAARIIAEAQVGAVPICGEDNKLKGMLTDRDIVTKVVAQGMSPISVHVSEIAQGEIVTVDANATIGEVMRTMSQHQIRRVPVLDNHQLVGIIAQADVARALDDPSVGELLDALSVP